MGKTIRLTEEQIRRFFGEGFGRKLIGEDTENVAGNATYRGNLNKKRFDQQNGKDSIIATAQQFGKSVIGPDMFNQRMNSGSAGVTKEGSIDAIIKLIFQEQKKPVNVIDLLKILNVNLKKNDDVKKTLDLIDISTILSGFIGLKAPDYVYYRLLNLDETQLAQIEKRFGKDFSKWGQRCDGCGAVGWRTTVPVGEHNDAYTLFDFGATTDNELDNSGTSLKESAEGNAGPGFKTKEVSFVEQNILEMHHINGDPSNNSAYNITCLCPNCHACIDSTAKGKSINFDLNTFIMDNATVNGNSILGMLSDEKIAEIRQRISSGYYSDRSLGSEIMYGENLGYTTDIMNKIKRLNIPPYIQRFLNVDVFAKSINDALNDAKNFALNHCATFDKLYKSNEKDDDETISEGRKPKEDEKKIGHPFIERKPSDRKIMFSPGGFYVRYSLEYFSSKSEAVIKVYNDSMFYRDVIVINHLGDEIPDEREVSNIIDQLIMSCLDSASDVLAKPTGNKTDFAERLKSGDAAFQTNDTAIGFPKPAQIYNFMALALAEMAGRKVVIEKLDTAGEGGKVQWGVNTVRAFVDWLKSDGVYGVVWKQVGRKFEYDKEAVNAYITENILTRNKTISVGGNTRTPDAPVGY